MDTIVLDKIHLCINELSYVKDMLNLKKADDFTSRLLAIYAMVRIDDVTKFWSHNIKKNDAYYAEVNRIKDAYNQGLRSVRDKLGAHYQSPSDKADLFGSIQIFKSIDYANVECIIEDVIKVENAIEGAEYEAEKLDAYDTINVGKLLDSLYTDDQAYLTNGALDVFGINKGGLIACTPNQAKGQYLRSIEQMVETTFLLMNGEYINVSLHRMFKRLFVCMVYNYHDNLITRTDISQNAVQSEDGFDRLFLSLITENDNREELENAFENFEKIHKIEPLIKKYRSVRDHTCAHFDKKSTVEHIDNELDSLDSGFIYEIYKKLLTLFNYICNNVLTLQMLSLPTRTRLFGSQFETIADNETFYGEKPQEHVPRNMSITDVFRSIHKHDKNFDEAVECLRKLLFSLNDEEYYSTIRAIKERLQMTELNDEEITVIFNALLNSKRSGHTRMQKALISMMLDKTIFEKYNGHLLWVLSNSCVEDEKYDIKKYLETIITRDSFIAKAMAILAYMHLTITKKQSCYPERNKAHKVDVDFASYCDMITNPIEKVALTIMLSQRWFHDDEYAYARTYEKMYSDYFENITANAVQSYFEFVKLKDEEEIAMCKKYLQTKHYLLLLYRLTVNEEERKQKDNLFIEMWNYNCFYRTRFDMYEAFGVGLMTEITGNQEMAKEIFESIVEDHPINESAIRTLNEFKERHKDLYN